MNNITFRSSNEIYDVSTYTDRELYDILDINSPTDHELEARIIFLIRKYTNMQNESGDELAHFFTAIYKRFFETSDSENEEEEQPTLFQDSKMASVINEFKQPIRESMTNMDARDIITTTFQNSTPLSSQSNIISTNDTTINSSNNIGYTKTLDYATGTLNPLLNQTIKRIISIDSQYRDDKKSLSSNFTFHLSEPLKDVVSMKLYSVQIPYTWYTISTGYGCNLVYLKGNSPGIDNGAYDYQISISPGNYSTSELATAVNKSISTLKTTYTDVSFATTAMNYNSNTSLNTFVIDITKQYNETSYDISFAGLTSPYNTNRIGSSGVSIPGFLGFANSRYAPYIISSAQLFNTNQTKTTDSNLRIYSLNSSNNYFTVYKYIGPDEYSSSTSTVDVSFNIKFSLATKGLYTRSELLADISNQINSSSYLDSTYSYIKRLDVSNTTLDPSTNGFLTTSVFQLALKTNRSNTNNTPYSKLKVVFQSEPSTVNHPIWIGLNSCFGFLDASSEMNTIVSNTNPVGSSSTTFTLTTPYPQILLNCNKKGYISSGNNYTITLSPIPGMTLLSYVDVVTNAFLNNSYTNEIGSSYAEIDSSSNFKLSVDVNKNIDYSNFQINLSNFGRFNSNYSDYSSFNNGYTSNVSLNSNTSVFDLSFTYRTGYNITNTSQYLLSVYPTSSTTHVTSDISYNVPNPTGVYTSLASLATALTNALNNFTDSYGTAVLAGSSVTISQPDSTYTYVTATISIKVNKILTQNDYSIQFVDYSGNSVRTSSDPYNSWYQYLHIDPIMIDYSYNLYNNSTRSSLTDTSNVTISSTPNSSFISVNSYSSISQNTITLNATNNYFDLIPYESGLTTGTQQETSMSQNPLSYNSIRITVPYQDDNQNAIAYTRENLLTAINSAFANTDASGSQISVISNNGVEYTKIRITINKIFSASDYRVVFYDTISFVKCYIGTTSVKNSTWDSTLGWILGFRLATTYLLVSDVAGYKGAISIVGDTGVSTNLFNYFLICLDDYNQSHLNDGLVTVTPRDTSIPLPSYANITNFTCDPVSGQKVYNTSVATDNNQLTQNQIYSLTQIANSQSSTTSSLSNLVSTKSFGQGPFVSDVFAIVPMKVSGLPNGSNYVEFSGSLQNQQRTYFGPVNITKMSVKLVNDRGDVIDLNNANWSFSVIVECLYQQKPSSKNKT